MPPPVAVSWHDVLPVASSWRASNTWPYEKRHVRRRAMNMHERQNDKIVRISARSRLVPLFFPPPIIRMGRGRERGGKAHVRRRNGRAISVDMRCLKTATIRRCQPEVFVFFPLSCFFLSL